MKINIIEWFKKVFGYDPNQEVVVNDENENLEGVSKEEAAALKAADANVTTAGKRLRELQEHSTENVFVVESVETPKVKKQYDNPSHDNERANAEEGKSDQERVD